MARKKKSSKPLQETRTSLMFPSLHQDVLDAVSDAVASTLWFNNNDSEEGSIMEYSTFVTGRFKCNNDKCLQNGWNSNKVAIWIRGYPENGYNAVIFNQHCKSCNELGTMRLDDSYAERVAYRLKKWAGVPVEKQNFVRRKTDPHIRELCEGCKAGHCEK